MPTSFTISRTPGRRVLIGLVVVIGLLFGFAVASLIFREEAPSNFSGAPSVDRIDLPAAGAIASVTPVLAPAAIEEPGSAESALRQFLDAEIARRSDVSFALLDDRTATRFGTVAAWQSQRANRLLPESFTVTSTTPTASGADVTIEARRTPAITPLNGLVPAQSTEIWRVDNGSGRWRVQSGQPADVRPVLPSDAAAVDVARAWLAAAEACEQPAMAASQLGGALLGSPALAAAPCDRPESFSASGDAVVLAEQSNSTVFVSAFGPGVGRWARAVAVDGDPRFTIVLAPLGDEWRVMGLVADASPRP